MSDDENVVITYGLMDYYDMHTPHSLHSQDLPILYCDGPRDLDHKNWSSDEKENKYFYITCGVILIFWESCACHQDKFNSKKYLIFFLHFATKRNAENQAKTDPG